MTAPVEGGSHAERRCRQAVRVRVLLGEGSTGVPAVRRLGGELGILRRHPPSGGARAAEDDPVAVPVEGRGRAGAAGREEGACLKGAETRIRTLTCGLAPSRVTSSRRLSWAS
jgi:hypothetical protein